MLSSDRRFDKQKNAMAIFSKAHGKGLESAIARKLAKFTIEARDAEGARMQHGGDTFTVTIHGASVVRARVQDNEDGTYSVEYKAAASGAYSISVLLYGLALPESPWSLNVLTARPDAEQCHLHGAALTRAAARETMSFEVSFADAHGNPTHAEDLDVYVVPLAELEDDDDGLQQLKSTKAEAKARGWAREWACARIAALHGLHVDAIHDQLKAEEARLKKAAEAPPPEAAEALPAGPLLPLPTPPPHPKNKNKKGGRKSPTDVSAPLMTKVKADETKNVGAQEQQAGDSGVAQDPVRDEDDGYSHQTTDAPVYRKVAQRIVVGIKPLIVRIGSSVDSELTGLISPGSKLQVVETRQEGNCLRALVLIDQSNAEHPLSPRTPGTARGLPSSPRTRFPSVRPAMPPESWVEVGEWPEPFNKLPPPANVEESLVLLIDQACGNTTPIQKQNPVAFQRKREVGREASELIGKAGGTRDNLRPLLSALIDDVMACTHGWVTAAREGQELLTRVHEGVNAGSRQQHITLWDRRKAADKLNSKQVTSGGSAKDSKDRMLAGPSFSHELAADPSGIGVCQRVSNSIELFAFGGVDPGVLHAHGQVIKTHNVRYSVGLAGRYRLHVGLRQQGVALPGSPFLLTVTPSHAHARSSSLPADCLPLVGHVCRAGEVSCGMIVKLCDRMGNRCTSGGASLNVVTSQKERSKVDAHLVKTFCLDQQDGSYNLQWQSQRAGTYMVSVTISNVHLVGSPMELKLLAGPPEVDKCVVSGDGITSAQAGRPALVALYCKDAFDNPAGRSSTISFGLVLVPRDSKDVLIKKETSEVLLKTADNPLGVRLNSMPFNGGWVGEQFEIRYTAQEAGEFGLHIWSTDAELIMRKFVPGSPFSVRVSGVRASAAGSYLSGTEQYEKEAPPLASPKSNGVLAWLQSGDRLILWPRLRDEFGNASYATEGALVASLETPDGHLMDLPMKQLKELGKYELSYDTQKKGLHTLHTKLFGERIVGSPFRFFVVPGAPVASKCRLHLPDESPVVNCPCEIRLEAVDKYGNRLDSGGCSVVGRVVGTGVSAVTVTDNADGSYTLSFTGTVAGGECRLVVRLEKIELEPVTITFVKPTNDETKPEEAVDKKPGK